MKSNKLRFISFGAVERVLCTFLLHLELHHQNFRISENKNCYVIKYEAFLCGRTLWTAYSRKALHMKYIISIPVLPVTKSHEISSKVALDPILKSNAFSVILHSYVTRPEQADLN